MRKVDDTLCEQEFPVEANCAEGELPNEQYRFIEINAELATQWPNISLQKLALEDAKQWDGVRQKHLYLNRNII